MHLIDNRFDGINLQTARGLCRGMARNSELGLTDAFELFIAVGRTREVFSKLVDNGARTEFLRIIVNESASDLYMLSLVAHMKESFKGPLAEGEQFRAIDSRSAETNAKLLSDVQEVNGYIEGRLREHYLATDAPSVFERFQRLGLEANRVDPIWFLFAWQRLGTDAESDQQGYLRSLFARRPEDLKEFLKMMFRVDFMDDYTALKPLIDYKELSGLIALNEGTPLS